MRTTSAACAGLLGAMLFTGGAALADDRCAPGQMAAGLCAHLYFVDDDGRRPDVIGGAYRRGYEDGRRGYDPDEFVPRPPDVALDGKEGYSLGYKQQRRYVDRDVYGGRSLDRDDYRRRVDRDDYRRRVDRDDYRRRADRDQEDFWRRLERDDYRRRVDRDDYRRRVDRDDYDEYYARRLRQDDASPAVNMATELLRRALSN